MNDRRASSQSRPGGRGCGMIRRGSRMLCPPMRDNASHPGDNMTPRRVLCALAVLLVAVGICSAQDPNVGTWKLNESKSKLAAGMPKNLMVKVEAAGDSTKVTVDGVDGMGKPTHNEWTGKSDGKDYPVTGDPNSDSRAYKKVDDRTMDLTVKKGGKVTMSGKIVTSADGKSRTVTVHGMDASGKEVQAVSVYDRQ